MWIDIRGMKESVYENMRIWEGWEWVYEGVWEGGGYRYKYVSMWVCKYVSEWEWMRVSVNIREVYMNENIKININMWICEGMREKEIYECEESEYVKEYV